MKSRSTVQFSILTMMMAASLDAQKYADDPPSTAGETCGEVTCGAGEECLNGACFVTCGEVTCAAHEECREGECLVVEPPFGLDALRLESVLPGTGITRLEVDTSGRPYIATRSSLSRVREGDGQREWLHTFASPIGDSSFDRLFDRENYAGNPNFDIATSPDGTIHACHTLDRSVFLGVENDGEWSSLEVGKPDSEYFGCSDPEDCGEWSGPEDLSGCRIAIDSDSLAHIMFFGTSWIDNSQNYTIYYTTATLESATQPVEVAHGEELSGDSRPQLVLDELGRPHMFWSDGYNIYGGTPDGAAVLFPSPEDRELERRCGSCAFSVSSNSSGAIYLLWTETAGEYPDNQISTKVAAVRDGALVEPWTLMGSEPSQPGRVSRRFISPIDRADIAVRPDGTPVVIATVGDEVLAFVGEDPPRTVTTGETPYVRGEVRPYIEIGSTGETLVVFESWVAGESRILRTNNAF